jgi:O-antigen ligase
MERAAGLLGPAVLLAALGLAPALGYATTFVVLAACAVAALWQRGRLDPPSLLLLTAFLLLTVSAVLTLRTPADLLPLLGFSALLFHAPLARLIGGADLTRYALIGAAVGLATTLLLRFGLNIPRAAEGFWLTDPYRLAVTTLVAAFLGLGALFTDQPRRWWALLGLAAALIVIVLTGSRTALVALPVLLLVTGLCLARRPSIIAAVLVATAAIVIAALFVELPGTARIRLRDVLASIASGGPVADAAIDIRLGLYRAAAELFALSPLTGHGWGEATMPLVREQLTPEQLSWGQVVHLHNDIAQFAVSGGLLGLIGWVLMLATPLAGWLWLPLAERTPQRRHALLVVMIGAAVLGLPDSYLAAPMTLTVYVVLVAAITGRRAIT